MDEQTTISNNRYHYVKFIILFFEIIFNSFVFSKYSAISECFVSQTMLLQ